MNKPNSCGIVVEYNPMHKGHLLHIQKAKELSGCDVLIAVMSGNYVQRGDTAILDKWQRTNTALANGVDLVIELPYIFATQAANGFAHGAITSLKIAQVDSIVFGSESNNIEELKEMAKYKINPEHIRESLDSGLSFVSSYGLLAPNMHSNDILAVAYLKELEGSSIKPYSIQRTTNYLDNTINDISSATALRLASLSNKIPEDEVMYKELLSSNKHYLKDYYPYLRNLLLTLDTKYLSNLFLFSEGIENHLYKQALVSDDCDSFINNATTRRYTTSRIKRCLIQLLNQITKEDVKNLPSYNTIRILGFNEKGKEYLQYLKQEEVNVASKFGQVQNGYKEMELKTTMSYCMFLEPDKRKELIEKEIGSPIIIR